MSPWNVLLVSLAAAGVTLLLRATPFLLFSSGRPLPPVVRYISRMLSPAIIAMLVVYCFGCYARDSVPADHLYGFAELAGTVITVGLQTWKRNPLLSILCGTIAYMLLLQFAG